MNPEIGRYLEGRLLVTQNLIKTVYDYAMGQGPKVVAEVLPAELWLTLSFPRGGEIPDPLKRLKGPKGTRLRTLVRDSSELDLYLRRMIDAAHAQEG